MTLQELAWLAMAAYAVHIMEEFSFDWRNWARSVIGLPVEWADFYVTNAVVIALGIVQASLAPTMPVIPLIFASLMIINALFFHILPVLKTRGRYSPGVATAVVLFLPIGLGMFWNVHRSGMLDWLTLSGAVIGGALLMAYPVVMLNLRSHPYFDQTRPVERKD